MRTRIFWGLLILLVFLLGSPVSGVGQDKAPAPAPQAGAALQAEKQAPPAEKPALPDPKAVLQQMCDFLKNQPQFSFKAEVTNDQVYQGGKKLQYGQEVEAFFRRPDKLRLNGDGDLESKQLIFDGKTLTLYDKNKNHYASLEVPGDIDTALAQAYKDYGLKVGLADLGAANLWDHAGKNVTNALYVGLHKVRGVPCHHLAFDRKDIHYQIWIEAGDKPLVRKIVITHKTRPGSPQWTAYFSDWNLSPTLADDLFTFVPPAGAEKIKFLPVKKAGAPTPKAAPGKKKGGKS